MRESNDESTKVRDLSFYLVISNIKTIFQEAYFAFFLSIDVKGSVCDFSHSKIRNSTNFAQINILKKSN